VQEIRIGDWLDQLGSGAPTPGGGAAAAFALASAAALVEMVANLTTGRAAYAEHESHARAVGAEAGSLRRAAVDLATADEAAFGGVLAAYRMPRGTAEEKAARTAAIAAATAAAAGPPLRVAAAAARVIELAAALPDRCNPNVLSDVGVAASLAVAALESAAINVEVNLKGVPDLARHLDRLALGRETVDLVRRRLG
jgi:methenyltetrahydrofolate cyclohydrolase